MHRRYSTQSGHVNFPMHLESSREGGMFVRLWVMDTDAGVGKCCGTYTVHEFGESFIGSDITKQSQLEAEKAIEALWGTPKTTIEEMDHACNEESRIHEKSTEAVAWYGRADGMVTSHPLVADILMGSTGWSNSDFICEYSDLTELGKEMYITISAMYPQCKVALVTFLDT